MNPSSDSSNPSQSLLWPAVLAGGFLAGTLDGASAVATFGWRMCYGIASGLLGKSAIAAATGGDTAIWLLGAALHYLIAFTAAAAYVAASRRWEFLRDRFLLGGAMCGCTVYLVMNLLVLPLSAIPAPIGPFSVKALRLGLGYHVLLVGLPISLSLWFFARRARLANVAPA